MDKQTVESARASSMSFDDIAQVLQQWNEGEPDALNKLFSQVFHELRRIAQHLLQGEREDHTLPPAALVHELYIRLSGQRKVEWENSRQFFVFAAQLMRLILVDHARRHQASKRGKGLPKATLDEVAEIGLSPNVDLVRLDEALKDLADLNFRQSKIVELRFFAGLSIQEIGAVLGCSRATVLRDWRTAKLWLFRQLQVG